MVSLDLNSDILSGCFLDVNTGIELVMGQNIRLKTRSNSAFRLIYHLILVTKFRRRFLSIDILTRMKSIINELLVKWECELVEFGGESDHVHLLIETHPSVDLSKLVNNLKTVTSRKLRAEFSEYLKKFYWGTKAQFWSGSYAIISVGAQAPLYKLIEYIQNQEKPE
jgi:putative transposase